MRKNVYILGGDKRFSYLRDLLCEIFECNTNEDLEFDPRKMEAADIVILPYPLTFDGKTLNAPYFKESVALERIFSYSLPHQLLLSGGEIPKAFNTCSCKVKNYAKDEELLKKNAALTAEGLLKLVIEELPVSLTKSSVAITGYGRVGKETAKLLANAGSNVTVFARRGSSRDKAKQNGIQALEYRYLAPLGSAFDCIINTVPELVLGEEVLSKLEKSCVILEAASAPYGIDFNIADKLGIKTIIAGSLPGKVSPLSAAEIICESIIKLCFEGG